MKVVYQIPVKDMEGNVLGTVSAPAATSVAELVGILNEKFGIGGWDLRVTASNKEQNNG